LSCPPSVQVRVGGAHDDSHHHAEDDGAGGKFGHGGVSRDNRRVFLSRQTLLLFGVRFDRASVRVIGAHVPKIP